MARGSIETKMKAMGDRVNQDITGSSLEFSNKLKARSHGKESFFALGKGNGIGVRSLRFVPSIDLLRRLVLDMIGQGDHGLEDTPPVLADILVLLVNALCRTC